MPRSLRSVCCLLTLCAFFFIDRDAAAQSYTIRKLTAPGLAHGFARDIDNYGTVVGELLDVGGEPHAVVWRAAQGTPLPELPGGGLGSAITIDREGRIGGSAANASTTGSATIWSPTGNSWTAIDLGTGAGATVGLFAAVLGLHGSGLAVGYVDDGIFSLPVAWLGATNAAVFQQLPMPVWAISGEALATCGPSMIVGYVADFANSVPAVWDLTNGAPQLTLLPTLNGRGTIVDTNQNGVAVGSSTSSATGFDHLVSWSNGTITDLGHLPGTDCYAASINADRDLVGWARTYSVPAFVAVAKLDGQAIVDLNALLPPQSGWQLVRALGINDQGAIVGAGIKNGFFEPFLMTPTRVVLDSPQPGLAGLDNTFATIGATPLATVYYCVALAGGQTVIAGCVEGLDLAAPLVFGAVAADANGNASITIPVPALLAQLPLLFQAYDYAGCATSNVVAHSF